MNSKNILKGSIISAVVMTAVFAFASVASAVTVTPAAMGSWTNYSTGTGSVTFVVDSGMTNGAAEFNTPDGAAVAGLDLMVATTSIADIGTMSYTEKGVSGSAFASPAYFLGIDTNDTGTVDMYAWYEPVYNGGSDTSAWQTYTLDKSTSRFWSHTAVGMKGSANGANMFTLDDVVAAYPNAKVAEVSLNQGSGNDGWVTRVDSLTFNGSIYDFGPNPAPTTAYVNADNVCASQTPCYTTIQAAVDAVAENGVIEIKSDITTSSEVTVNHAITINGNGHTLFSPFDNSANDNANNAGLGIIEVGSGTVTVNNLTVDGTSGVKTHGINIFDASNVALNDVTVQNNDKAGITVNGSTVTANNITTKNNAWGGINADLADDATIRSTVLNVTGTSAHTETGPAIWKDDNTKVVTVNVGSEYSSQTYTHDAGVVGTIYGFNAATVNNEAELRAALSNSLVQTITFGSDITLDAELDVTRVVTIDGANHSLVASFSGTNNSNNSVINITSNNVTIKNLVEDGGTASASVTTGNRGINIYAVTGILLDNVTASNNSKNGIVVNGSTVTVNNITTSGNGWEGIDVDMGSGVTTPASLTVNGTSVQSESPQASIRIDDTTKNATVTDTNNQYSTLVTGNTKDYFLNTKNIRTGAADSDTTTTSGGTDVTVDVPAGTVVQGSSDWDGQIKTPTIIASQGVTPSSNNTQTSTILSIEVGSSQSFLTLSKAAKLTFSGLADKLVGWSFGGTFHPITATCATGVVDEPTATASLAPGADCKMNVGGDLVVYTKHFSVFVTYTQTAVASGGGGGGGGGNGPVFGGGGSGNGSSVALALPNNGGAAPGIAVAQNATANANNGNQNQGQGQVLGASTFNFTGNLTIGSRGTQVIELQKFLLAQGFSIPAIQNDTATYGYFGTQTRTALAAYQRAHGISPAVGYFGPLTRAVVNATAVAPIMTDAQRTALIASLLAQLQVLQAKLNAMIAAGQQ